MEKSMYVLGNLVPASMGYGARLSIPPSVM